jgi:hypothetical protein
MNVEPSGTQHENLAQVFTTGPWSLTASTLLTDARVKMQYRVKAATGGDADWDDTTACAAATAACGSQDLRSASGPTARCLTVRGPGDEIGIRGDSAWNNLDPEIVGATLGYGVRLRVLAGRSVHLLGETERTARRARAVPSRFLDAKFGLGWVAPRGASRCALR